MEKRRVRLEINGVVVGLITEESDAYMQELAQEIGDTMIQVQAASPLITREAAALMIALNYCDESKKGDDRLLQMRRRVNEAERKALEAERAATALKKENTQLWDETEALLNVPGDGMAPADIKTLQTRIAALEAENAMLKKQPPQQSAQGAGAEKPVKLKNPLRHDEAEQQGFVSFFAKENAAEPEEEPGDDE